MCNINILPPVRIDNEGTVVVSGTVEDCAVDPIEGGQISVTIDCNNESLQQDAEVFSDGFWVATFSSTCPCGGQVRIEATCASDPLCSSQFTEQDLPCIECPKISIKVEETDDDVFKTNFTVTCQEDGSAHVAFQYTYTNEFQIPITVDVDCGPGGTPVAGTNETFPPNATNTVDVICSYPSPSIPQIFLRFLSNGELLGCPPLQVGGPVVDVCPKCQRDLPNIQVEEDGCKATFTGDFVSPECTFVVNFDEPGFSAVPQNSLNFSHNYSSNGSYTVGIVMTCGGCDYVLPGVQVEITDCNENDDDDDVKPPSNPWFCGPLRSAMAVAAGLALFFLVMIICIPAAWLAFAIAAAVSAVVGIVAGILHSIFCPKKPCQFALLSSAQAAISAGSMLITYSLCCPWVIWAGLGVLAAGIGLLFTWKKKCNKGACATATEVAYVFLVLIPAIGTILLFLVVLMPCHNPLYNGILGAIYSFITLYALGCDE